MSTGATRLPPAWVADAVQEARRAWPMLRVGDDFASHLEALEAKAGDAPPAGLRIADLCLAHACARRDTDAIALFEATYFDEVDAAARRFSGLPVGVDDVKQRVRQKLFLDEPPALASYAGRGELRGWLRASVLHLLINIASRESRERPTEGAFFDALVDTTEGAEAAYLKLACRDDFKAAFTAALERLAPREKALLQYAFADGLTVDEIGAIFGVHRATAARWVERARARLSAETRDDLMARLHVDEDEAASILRAALSRVGPTLLRRLG